MFRRCCSSGPTLDQPIGVPVAVSRKVGEVARQADCSALRLLKLG
jgi:hypothetical protein